MPNRLRGCKIIDALPGLQIVPNKVFQSNPESSDPTIFKNKELDVKVFIKYIYERLGYTKPKSCECSRIPTVIISSGKTP